MYWYCGYCWYIGTGHSTSLYQYVTGTTLVLLFICTGTVGTVGTLVPATLFLCTNMLLVLHRYCTGTALYMYWYCGYCWYTGTSHSMSLYQYVTGTALVLLFICTGTVGTVGTLVPATLCLCTNMLLVLHWYCCLYVLVLWILLVHWYLTLCLCTNMLLVLLFICTGTVDTVGTLVPATLCLCTNMLPVLDWYCCLYVLVLWVLLVHWYQPLYFSI